MRKEIIRLDRVTQRDDGVTLLDGVNLHIFEGEIMGLVCIDSEGQDALVNLLCENIPIHYGYIYFEEQLVNSYKSSSMELNHVSVIEERSRLVESLTVADNIFVLRRGFKKYVIDPRVLKSQLALFTEDLGIHIDANEIVDELSSFERCVTELLKAVVTGVKLVVLRDISNFIGPADLLRFQELIRRYAAQGMSFLYICNHHEETFRICDRVSLMECGKIRKLLRREEFRDDIISHFTLDFSQPTNLPQDSDQHSGVLKFRHVFTEHIHDMSFTIEQGECAVFLDVNSLVLTDLFQLMTGDLLPQSGKILLNATDWCENREKLRKYLSFIKENPLQSMLFREMSYIDNLCFLLDRKSPLLWMNRRFKQSILKEYEPLVGEDIHAYDITGLSPASLYNLVYYRVHLYHPEIVFCIQPFAGADMYLRHHLVHLINELRARKITVVILAVSMSDSLVVADRLLMLEQGHLLREYRSGEFHLLRGQSAPVDTAIPWLPTGEDAP